jgi:hypothetical protein
VALPAPINCSDSPPEPAPGLIGGGRHAVALVLIATLLLNGLVIALGAINLSASQRRAVERAQEGTANLAYSLEKNLANSAQGIDQALLSISDSLEEMVRHGEMNDASIPKWTPFASPMRPGWSCGARAWIAPMVQAIAIVRSSANMPPRPGSG